MKHFGVSTGVAVVALGVAGWWGMRGAGLAGALHDTWMAIASAALHVALAAAGPACLPAAHGGVRELAAFVTCLLLPVLALLFVAGLSPFAMWELAAHQPAAFALRWSGMRTGAAVFGAVFALLTCLDRVLAARTAPVRPPHPTQPLAAPAWEAVHTAVLVTAIVVAVGVHALNGEHPAALTAGLLGVLVHGVAAMAGNAVVHAHPAHVGSIAMPGRRFGARYAIASMIGAVAIVGDPVIGMLGVALGAAMLRPLAGRRYRGQAAVRQTAAVHGGPVALAVLALALARPWLPLHDLLVGALVVGAVVATLCRMPDRCR